MEIERLSFQPKDRILAVIAHPDDEVLGCFGTLANAVRAKAHVDVRVVDQGNQGRMHLSKSDAKSMGWNLFTPDENTDVNLLASERLLVQAIDGWMAEHKPSILIAHGDYRCDHHEHRAIGRASATSWHRYLQTSDDGCRLLRMHPLPAGLGFDPNVIVDIGPAIDAKCSALARMMKWQERWYLASDLNRMFASCLASHFGKHESIACAEVFDEERERSLFRGSESPKVPVKD